MQSALLRLGLVVVFAALLLAVMYLAVQYSSGPAAVILYDQYDTANWWGPPGDSEGQAADDFVIPAGQAWVITQVDVEGIYWDNNFGGNEYGAKSVNVELYQDDDALPGARIYAQNNISYTLPPPESTEPKVAVPLGTPVPDVHSSFVIRIAPVTLTSGPYWVSVWASMPDWQEGHLPRWVWVERLATANHPAAFRSGAGFGGCGISIWGHIGDCINTYSDSSEVDMVFRLRGTILTTKSPSAETPTALIPGITPTSTPTQFEPTGTPASLPPSATSTPTHMSTSTPEVSPTCTPTASLTIAATIQPTNTDTATPITTVTSAPSRTSTAIVTLTSTGTATTLPSPTAKALPTSTTTTEMTATPTIQPKGAFTPPAANQTEITATATVTNTLTATQTLLPKSPPGKP